MPTFSKSLRKKAAETTKRFFSSSSATIGVLLMTESVTEIARALAAAVSGGALKSVFCSTQSTRCPTRLNDMTNGGNTRPAKTSAPMPEASTGATMYG